MTTFSGAILTGGASRRMGTDKALIEWSGRPLVTVGRDALLGAGALEVLAVGGDAAALAQLGLTPVPDLFPGEGPLGGIITALEAATPEADVVVVLACDLPLITPDAVRAVLGGLGAADAAVPVIDGKTQGLLAAYRRRCLDPLRAAFADGVRAVHLAVAALESNHPRFDDPEWSTDLDDQAAFDDAVQRATAVATGWKTAAVEDSGNWIGRLADSLDRADCRAPGASGIGADIETAVLDAARVVAHGSGDRRNAPLACYVIGRWVAEHVGAGYDEGAAVAEARAVIDRLIAADAARGGTSPPAGPTA